MNLRDRGDYVEDPNIVNRTKKVRAFSNTCRYPSVTCRNLNAHQPNGQTKLYQDISPQILMASSVTGDVPVPLTL